MNLRCSYSRLRRGMRSAHPGGRAPTEQVEWRAQLNLEARFETEECRRTLRSASYSGDAPWVVLGTGPGNPPAVRFLAGGSVQFSSLPGHNPKLCCLGGFVTRTRQ